MSTTLWAALGAGVIIAIVVAAMRFMMSAAEGKGKSDAEAKAAERDADVIKRQGEIIAEDRSRADVGKRMRDGVF